MSDFLIVVTTPLRWLIVALAESRVTASQSKRVDRRAAVTSGASRQLKPYWPVYPSGTVALALATVALFETIYCGTSVRLSVTWPLV